MEKIDKFIPKFRYNYSHRILLLLMFSASSILKSQNLGSTQGKLSHQTDKIHLPAIESSLFKKSTMHTSQTLKASIISDSEYNSSIYEWRKLETAPIIKVIQLASRSEIDYVTGMSLTHKTIRPQRIFSSLSNFQQFSKQQLLLILKNLIEGHHSIFKKMKATSVSLDKCIVTLQGEVKVWVNHHLERNDISGEVLTKEEEIVKRIFQVFCFLGENNFNNHILSFISYVNSTMSKTGKWTFYALRAMIKSYVVSLRIKLPDRIKLQNLSLKSQIKEIRYSETGQQESQRYRRNSLQIAPRNIKSSLLYSKLTNKDLQASYFEEKQVKQGKEKSENPTSKKNIDRVKSFSKFSTFNDDLIKQTSTSIKQTNNEARQHRKIPSINDVLLKKIGFNPLPEALPEDESSAASARKQGVQRPSFDISNQVNVCIQKQQKEQGFKHQKISSISTSNQTSISGTNFGFQKKIKESQFIEQKENFPRDQLKTMSREAVSASFVPKSEDCKKAVGSCTNWPSSQQKVSDFSISNLLKKVHSPQKNQYFQARNTVTEYSDQKIENPNQILSFRNISQEENNLSPIAKSRKLLQLYKKNPMSLLNQLKSQEQLQSYEITSKHSTDSPSRSARSGKFPIEEKILELLGLNQPLRTSSYVDTNSEQKIKQFSQTPARDKQKRLRHLQQTLSELMKANLRQEQIIEGNCWTKKIQNLVGFDSQLKQSINFGMEQANALIRELKLSKLGKCGRQIGHSLIPE